MKKDISLMTYKPGYHFVLENPITNMEEITEKLYKKYQNKEYSVHETAVLKVLAIYEYLNKYNLERVLPKFVPEAIRKADYGKILKQLVEERAIYKLFLDKGEENVIVYCLTPAAAILLKKSKLIHLSKRILKTHNTEYILSKISLNQLMISVSLNYPVVSWKFDKMLQLSTRRHNVDGYMRIKSEKYAVELYLSVYPKNNETGRFLENILLVNDYINENSSENNSTGSRFCVILCDSIMQIKEAYKLMLSYDDTKQLQVLFSIDGFSLKKDALNWLYLCETDKEHNCLLRNLALPITKIEGLATT